MSKQTSSSRKLDYSVPAVDGDFYRVANLLNDTERAVVKRVRDFMEREIAPIIDDYWGATNFLLRSFQSSPRSKSAA
jgi:glutaryl-CoA dehydrogenase